MSILIKTLKTFLLNQYGLSGEVTPLAGELDLNFKVVSSQGEEFVLKLFAPERDQQFLDFQEKILLHLQDRVLDIEVPKIIKSKSGSSTTYLEDDNAKKRNVLLLSWISGRIWNQVNPKTENLRYQLGSVCGKFSNALVDFDHDFAHRSFEWDVANGLWTKNYLDLFDAEDQNLLTELLDQFESVQSQYQKLQKSIVHNDANDFNCIVSEDRFDPSLVALIDFGDAVHTQIINDVAISCSYAIMGFEDPLQAAGAIVKGYHDTLPIEEEALNLLYLCIAIRLIISVTKSRINKIQEPDNTYLQISDKAAWDLLRKWNNIDPEFAKYTFRGVCGFAPHPKAKSFTKWVSKQSFSLKSLFPSLDKQKIFPLDLSISSDWLGQPSEFNNLNWFDFQLGEIQKEHPGKIIAGGYLESRPLYTDSAYEKMGNEGLEHRCVHLGIDFWVPKNTPINSIFDAEVVYAVNDVGNKKYGGLLILKHLEDGIEFFTLYGHLSASISNRFKAGDKVKKGDEIGFIGTSTENGNWAPHLHFQIMLSLMNYKNDFPGVAYFNEIKCWSSVCPDPNLLFAFEELQTFKKKSAAEILESRQKYLGKSMSLQYKEPLHIVRGSGAYLIDQKGKRYLDTVNNVAHVGHEHPRVVRAGQKQMALLNTNSRYLHENITKLTQNLKRRLPPELKVFHFVNSGSEANELALRMVKAVTGSNEMLVSEVGYHGNTNGCVGISSYKFDGKGGVGAPASTHVFPMPNPFRGKYRGSQTAEAYSKEVQILIDKLTIEGKQLGGFIIEPILSCGGQVELPNDFLKLVYPIVRKSGGLCISDEVQTGCGRMGKTFWGFQLHGVTPDIITLGKPLGNGHPVAAVVCTEEVADKFANGMEFFNTFGGNPVSCAIANEVLEVVQDQKLQSNAFEVGNYLKSRLKELALEHPILGSIRGQGLFLGIELITPEGFPLPVQADYLVNRMKNSGILMSTDGPDHNVIKIKPPLIFSIKNAQHLIKTLSKIMKEDAMQPEFN